MTGWQVFFALLALAISSASAIVSFGNLLFNLTRTSPDEFIKGVLKWTNLIGISDVPAWAKDPKTYSLAIEWGRRILFFCVVAAVIGGVKWYGQNEQAAKREIPAAQTPTPSATSSPDVQVTTSTPKTPSNQNIASDEIPLSDSVVHGRITPANDPTPLNACSGMPASSDTTVLLMGDSAMGLSGPGSFIPLMIRDCPAMEMKRTSDSVFFNAQLFDQDSNQVVRIVDNRIDALNGETYSARQSQDRGTITIKNHNGAELFYVRFINKNTVRVRGFFGCGQNRTVRVTDDTPIAGMNMHHICTFNGHIGININ